MAEAYEAAARSFEAKGFVWGDPKGPPGQAGHGCYGILHHAPAPRTRTSGRLKLGHGGSTRALVVPGEGATRPAADTGAAPAATSAATEDTAAAAALPADSTPADRAAASIPELRPGALSHRSP